MKTYEYCSVLIWDQGGDNNNLSRLNTLIGEGWEPVRETGVSGGGAWMTVTWLCVYRRPIRLTWSKWFKTLLGG